METDWGRVRTVRFQYTYTLKWNNEEQFGWSTIRRMFHFGINMTNTEFHWKIMFTFYSWSWSLIHKYCSKLFQNCLETFKISSKIWQTCFKPGPLDAWCVFVMFMCHLYQEIRVNNSMRDSYIRRIWFAKLTVSHIKFIVQSMTRWRLLNYSTSAVASL